ncbi:hypothetical protein RR48_09947 [Papilio machaon]|uniref:Ig-like domain-containing protein n=1 Tax=Papilio machaon TaxID=76193 RepID=A0A194RIY3_PAPMA|nr:hypothetical protein RR48_09947 [Papilio machaon]
MLWRLFAIDNLLQEAIKGSSKQFTHELTFAYGRRAISYTATGPNVVFANTLERQPTILCKPGFCITPRILNTTDDRVASLHTRALRDVQLIAPSAVRLGDTVLLGCKWTLEGNETLYSVKWYRGRQEFFSYLPKEYPYTRLFAQPGINVDYYTRALRDVQLIAPSAVRLGDTVLLGCKWTLEGNETLYSVKWYRGRQEFFSYLPKEYPYTRLFAQPGINVDRFTIVVAIILWRALSRSGFPVDIVIPLQQGPTSQISKSSSQQVVLREATRALAGRFRCEVSADAPSFHTQVRSAYIHVVAGADEENYVPPLGAERLSHKKSRQAFIGLPRTDGEKYQLGAAGVYRGPPSQQAVGDPIPHGAPRFAS